MLRAIYVALSLVMLAGCASSLSRHPTTPAQLGAPVSAEQMLAALARPGAASVEIVVAADWRFAESFAPAGASPPAWRTGELEAQVFTYLVRHPTHGLILVDAGLPADATRHLGFILKRAFKIEETFVMRTSTAQALRGQTPNAVFITHLHWDHVPGVRDLPRETPLYVGPQDGAQRNVLIGFIAPVTRRALQNRPPLNAWRFASPVDDTLAILDIFGDGAMFALHVPGHTPGSTAYIINAADGVHLVTGDAIHSSAGWQGEILEPMSFEEDMPQARQSFERLQVLAARIPNLIVHPGHQAIGAPNPLASP